MTRCKFSDRRELWGKPISDIIGAPRFGILKSRNRFENMRSNIRFSKQSSNSGVYTEQNQWELCRDFIDSFNEHRKEHVIPSHFLCVDESISRWYGLGGSWIGVGCPQFVKLDRKPEHGLEMQNVACGRSGTMLGLKLVKSAEEVQRTGSVTNQNTGTTILSELCAPWADRERIICADIYFASLEAAEAMLEKNLKFTGLIKTATRRFPMKVFGEQEMLQKGNFNVLTSTINAGGRERDVVAMCWLDWNRCHFISTAGRTDVIEAQTGVRWRQHEDIACPVEVSISMPELVKDYFATAGLIDQHIRIRQDSLDLGKTIEVKKWSLRINWTLLGIVCVDAWLLYKMGWAGRDLMPLHLFWFKLGTILAPNKFDVTGVIRRPLSTSQHPYYDNAQTSGVGVHPTPMKRKRTEGGRSQGKRQKLCKTCPRGVRRKSCWLCSQCRDSKGVEVHLCRSQTGRSCFAKHLRKAH